MRPLFALRAVPLPLALLFSLMAHAALIAAFIGTDDGEPAPPRPGGVIAVEIVVEGPKSHPGLAPAVRRAEPPEISAAAPQPVAQQTQEPNPLSENNSLLIQSKSALPPRARRKPLHLADTGIPLEKPASVTRLTAHAPRMAQPSSTGQPNGLIRAALTPAAKSSAGDRGASPRGNNPKPAYPFVARRRGQEGQVLLNVEVLPNGTAARVEIARSSGFRSLDEAARHAVARWRFLPAQQGGAAVAALVTVPIRFSLH
jgi:protein TonB